MLVIRCLHVTKIDDGDDDDDHEGDADAMIRFLKASSDCISSEYMHYICILSRWVD